MTIIERAVLAAKTKAADQAIAESRLATPAPAQSSAKGTQTPRGDIVAFATLANRGVVVRESVDRDIFEQFRRLKRPLLQVAFGPLAEAGMHVVMVTSPLPGAGKTFISVNLANVLAMEKDRHVLLIDTDNAQRSLTHQLGLADRPGLFDMINDASNTIEQTICHTDVPGLSVLPSGRTVSDSLEWLNSSRCREIFRQIDASDPTQIVILDGPPLLVSSDAPAIAGFAGQTLLVVEAGMTTRSSVSKSLDLLDRNRPIGLILNKTPGKHGPGFYYGSPANDSNAE